MWLRISLFPDRPSFLAAVALDGNIYFKASDLGKFLGYSNIYSFAKRHSTKNLYEIIPQEFIPLHSSSSFRVMDFSDMIVFMRKNLKKHCQPYNDKLIKKLQDVWNFGTVSRGLIPKLLPISPNVAFILNVEPAGTSKNMRLQEWIQNFITMSLKMFERNKTDNNNSRIVNGIKIKREEDLDTIRKQFLNAESCQVEPDCVLSPSLSVKSTNNLDDNYFYWTPPPSVLNPSLICINDDESISDPAISSTSNQFDNYRPVINSSDQNNDIMRESADNCNSIFQMEYNGFLGNFPKEIHINTHEGKQVYVMR